MTNSPHLLDVEWPSTQVMLIHGVHSLLHKLFVFELHHTGEARTAQAPVEPNTFGICGTERSNGTEREYMGDHNILLTHNPKHAAKRSSSEGNKQDNVTFTA